MSVTAGIMIAVVVLIRTMAMDRLPKKTFLALWAVVLLRLMAPVALPSPVSLYNAVPEEALRAPRHFAPALIPGKTAETAAAVGAGPDLLAVVWVLGALAMAGFFLVSWFRCRRVFRESLPVEEGFARAWLSRQSLRRRVALRSSDRVSSPLTYGLLRPVILLPAGMDWSDTEKAGYILSHELYHIRRLDGLWKLLLTAALCLHWFNPLVWCMYVLANRDLELTCDEAVVRTYGEGVKSAYALTLLSMEERRSLLTPLCNSFSKNAIEERVRAIMKQKKTTVIAVAAAVMVVVGVTAVLATTAPKKETQAPPQAAVSQHQTGGGKTDVSLSDIDRALISQAVTEAKNLGWDDWDDEYGPKKDPQTGHVYTQKQYDQIAALKTAGYEKQSIAAFNRTVNKAFNDYEDYKGSLHQAYEALRQDPPAADDPLTAFLDYTLEASIMEYQTKLNAVYSGKEPDYAFGGRVSRTERADVFGEEVEVGGAEVYFIIHYDILDQEKLTVGERDTFLQSVISGIQTYLDGLDMKQKRTDEELEKLVQAELDRLGKAAATSHISYTRGELDGVHMYMEWWD